MSWGPLRFVDSMNVFPTSLASMIDDLRACTHKQLPELFPLMASLHPELQLRTPTDSPPQRRPLKQRRTHCNLEQAWDCILRKLPFEHFCGAEAWEMPARCGSSTATTACWRGRRCGREHRQRHGSTPTSWPWRTRWRATGTPSGRSRGSTPSTTSRCPGPPGTPCCGTRPARLPFTSSPTSRPTGTCGPPSWAG